MYGVDIGRFWGTADKAMLFWWNNQIIHLSPWKDEGARRAKMKSNQTTSVGALTFILIDEVAPQ